MITKMQFWEISKHENSILIIRNFDAMETRRLRTRTGISESRR